MLKLLDQPDHEKNTSKRSTGVVIGTHWDGAPFLIPEFGQSILVTGGPESSRKAILELIRGRFEPKW